MPTFLYWVLATFALSVAVAAQSAVPSAYSCPATDTGGNPNCPARTLSVNGQLGCVYANTPTSSCASTSNICGYWVASGKHIADADRGLCPITAASAGASTRLRARGAASEVPHMPTARPSPADVLRRQVDMWRQRDAALSVKRRSVVLG
ncbi:hypothetical protein RQP46_008499 [Phenoliferia psychrophenolica]